MSDTSARLELPFILPAQAQKHVTHNEALLRLDALVQLVLQDVVVDTLPASPSDGQLWAIGAAPTGDWAGHAGEIAQWVAPGWAFFAPQTGWRAWDAAAAGLKVFDGAAWVTAGGNQNQPGLGIQTRPNWPERAKVAKIRNICERRVEPTFAARCLGW